MTHRSRPREHARLAAAAEGDARTSLFARYTFAGALGRVDLAEVTQAALGPLARAETVGALRGAGSVRDALTLLLTSTEFQHR